MEDDSDNEHRALLGWIIGIAVALSITIALTSGIVATTGGAPAKAPAAAAPAPAAPAAAPAAAAPAPAPAPSAPSPAKLYFSSGAVALPDDAAATLAPVIEVVKVRVQTKLVVSGFHDRTGNPEQNAELARQRATAVRDALVAAGVAAERIELRKPAETEGGVEDREARRVEVAVE
jgi:outer membrane protein OmpA-like peptidoglycan-associated protein